MSRFSQPRTTIEACILVDMIRFPRLHAWETTAARSTSMPSGSARRVAQY